MRDRLTLLKTKEEIATQNRCGEWRTAIPLLLQCEIPSKSVNIRLQARSEKFRSQLY